MEQPLERSVSDVTVRAARRLVRRAPVRLRVPAELCEGLEEQRVRSFGRLVEPGTPIVLGLTIVLISVGLRLFGFDLDSAEGRLWWASEAVALGVAACGLFLVRRPGMLARYAEVVTVGSALALGTKLFVVVGVSTPPMALHASFVCVLLVTLISLAFRLPPTHVFLAYGGAACITLALSAWQPVPAPTTSLAWYLLAYAGVTVGIAHFAERQERLTYLQGVLLAYESGRSLVLNAELERIARTDPLTGIANRRTFDEQLHKEWERARREQSSVALLFIDVDHFKAFNDTYGHPAGDACLGHVAGALARVARRPADLAARYGGEEFVLLLPRTDLAGAGEVAEAVLAAVDALGVPHRSSRTSPHVTVSIGVAAMQPEPERDESALMHAADVALYRAKHEGRHRIRTSADDTSGITELGIAKRA